MARHQSAGAGCVRKDHSNHPGTVQSRTRSKVASESQMTTRREFLSSAALPLFGRDEEAPAKRIAAVVTEYRHNSHADVIVGKYLEGFRQNGQPPGPHSKVVAMYTAQVPKNDMSREMSRKHNVPIFPTIWETLTLGGDRLAVDGVLLIGEHGQYPWNEKGQHLYPRYELFL